MNKGTELETQTSKKRAAWLGISIEGEMMSWLVLLSLRW